MAKKATATKPVGMFSVAEHGTVVCQEIHQRGRHETILRVAAAAGEVLHELTLPEGSAGHFLDPRDRALFYLSDGARGETGVMQRLRRVELPSGTTSDFGPVNTAFMCNAVAVGEVHVAFFRNRALLVADHDGRTVLEHPVPALGEAYACALCEHGHLVAFSSGASGAQRVIDATILDLRSGAATLAIRQPDAPFSSKSAISALRFHPAGSHLVALGFYEGLSVFDLASAQDIADRFAPAPLDLADGRATTHRHHKYHDAAFDAAGDRLAVAFRPGDAAVHAFPAGHCVFRHRINVNPKAQKLVYFDGEALLFFDATGERVRLALST